MRNRSQNVTGEKVRSPKGHKPAPDRQKEAGESPDKKGITVDCHRLWGPGPVPSPWPGSIVRGGAGRMGTGGGGMLSAAGLFQKPWWVVLPHARKRGEKPNRTKTGPKQTEKRGKRAGEKRDNRKLSQRVSVFSAGPGSIVRAGGLETAGRRHWVRRGRCPLHGRAVLSAAARVEWEPVAGECCPPPGCFKNRGG